MGRPLLVEMSSSFKDRAALVGGQSLPLAATITLMERFRKSGVACIGSVAHMLTFFKFVFRVMQHLEKKHRCWALRSSSITTTMRGVKLGGIKIIAVAVGTGAVEEEIASVKLERTSIAGSRMHWHARAGLVAGVLKCF